MGVILSNPLGTLCGLGLRGFYSEDCLRSPAFRVPLHRFTSLALLGEPHPDMLSPRDHKNRVGTRHPMGIAGSSRNDRIFRRGHSRLYIWGAIFNRPSKVMSKRLSLD